MCEYWMAFFPWLFDCLRPRKAPPVPSIQDDFADSLTKDSTVTGDQQKVADAQKALNDDMTAAVASHATLTSDVVANGPTLVHDGVGNPFALLPQADGTVQAISLKDGTAEPTPPPAPPAS